MTILFIKLEVLTVLLCAVAGATCKIAEYDFVIENSWANPDGFYRNVLLINDQFVGPTIRATTEDIVHVNVINHLFSDIVSIHWHGLELPTAEYDGAHQITQYPIAPGQSFLYKLNLTLTSPGTYFYHSHINMQYGDGLVGAFIIDPPGKDPIAEEHNYEEEFVVLLQDWFHSDGKTLTATALHAPARVWQINKLSSVLFNGKGRVNCTDFPTHVCAGEAPLAHFSVQSGLKYRFRIICAATRVSLSFAVEAHSLTLVQSQGVDTVPFGDIKTLQMTIGSRYDVILHANQATGNYHIAAEVIGMTFAENNPNVNIQPSLGLRGFAVLHYDGADGYELSGSPFDSVAESAMPGQVITFNDLRLQPMPQQMLPQMATNIWVINSTKNAPETKWRLNGYLFHHPAVPLIFQLTQGQQFPMQSLVWTARQHDTLDIVFISMNNMEHPLHVHGYKFWLLGSGMLPYDPTNSTINNPMKYDTVYICGRGWVHIRLILDRPGPWLAHCHNDFHSLEQMSFVINVEPQALLNQRISLPTCDSLPERLLMLKESPVNAPFRLQTPLSQQDRSNTIPDSKNGYSIAFLLLIGLCCAIVGFLAGYFRRNDSQSISNNEVEDSEL